ncbi:MAG: helix-hairpin-helix domain-containing protein [Candidatus Acidiferrales bacterium]
MRKAIAHNRISRVAAVALAVLFSAAMCASAPPQKKATTAKPVDLNSATVEQLQSVPGIGPKTAQAIINFREKSGPFRRVEDLLAIKGISRRKLEELRRYVTVTPPHETKSQ